MKMLCILGLMVVLAFIVLAVVPCIVGLRRLDQFEEYYTLRLIVSVIILITIISNMVVDFYYNPESYGYQKIVSENCVESED